MAQLDAKRRARLPDSSFAYVDSRGRRRLPINDEAHVRNALARFGQTAFETEEAKERARLRLLRAAKKYGIVPIGFITGQLRSQSPRSLPKGFVTFLLTDIEESTMLLGRLGDRYSGFITDVRRLLRAAVRRCHGREVDARADEFFAVFETAPAALEAALTIQRELRDRAWPDDVEVRVRIGLHSGRPTLTDSGYVGLPVNVASRVSDAGHGGQIVLSSTTLEALDGGQPPDVSMRDLGSHRLHGLPEALGLWQVEVPDLPKRFPPLRVAIEAATPATEA